MSDETLSRAVLTFVWGLPRHPYPSKNPGGVRAEHGAEAEELLDRIAAILSVADAVEPDWQVDDESTAGDKVRDRVRARFPGLSTPAVEAVGNMYAYSWR